MICLVRSFHVERETELDLVRRLRSGDAAAFDAIHAAYHGRLFGFLVRLTRNRAVAEDLLEETWLRLVRHADRLQPDTQLGPWLFTVARNLYVSFCRARVAEAEAVASLSLWPVPPVDSPFDAVSSHEFESRVESALGDLSVPLREVLLLVGVEGLRPAEAAAVCGITPEALRQRLRRARQGLAERLDAAVVPLRRRRSGK